MRRDGEEMERWMRARGMEERWRRNEEMEKWKRNRGVEAR